MGQVSDPSSRGTRANADFPVSDEFKRLQYNAIINYAQKYDQLPVVPFVTGKRDESVFETQLRLKVLAASALSNGLFTFNAALSGKITQERHPVESPEYLDVREEHAHAEMGAMMIPSEDEPSVSRPSDDPGFEDALERSYQAIRSGDVVGLTRAIEECPRIASDPSWSLPLLDRAVEHGRPGIVSLLLWLEIPADQVGDFGVTPLMRAAANGHTEVIRLLLKAGAAPLPRFDANGLPVYCLEDGSE